MKQILILFLKVYKLCLSPHLSPACRYHPSCSEYAIEAIEMYGPWCGSWRAFKRLLRCRPYGAYGYDPVE